jgi:A/G-specific adenine glycosylase
MLPTKLRHKDLRLLREWFQKNSRPLSWRRPEPIPYEIWISEVMSQQSTMKTVVPYFNRWIQRFPTLEALANSTEEDVLKMWAGLGYYSRARNVLKAARILNERKDWPRNWMEWCEEIPGVGPYTAKAISSMAFSQPVIPVDGNVLRVFARLGGITNPLNSAGDRRRVEELIAGVESIMDPKDSAILAQAFMELGSLVCRPGALATCELCPLQSSCTSKAQGRVGEIPRSKQRPETLHQELLMHVVAGDKKDFRGVWAVEISKGQRLEGQWELPTEALNLKKTKKDSLLGPVRHSITKHRYQVFAQPGSTVPKKLVAGKKLRLLNHRDPDERLLLTTLSRKVLDFWMEN